MSPEEYSAFYNAWVKTYNKAFEDYFEHLPTIGPTKELMEPMRAAIKMYMDTSEKMSQLWINLGTPEIKKED